MRVRVVAAMVAVGLLAGCGTEEKKTAIQLLSGASDSAMKQKSAKIDIDVKVSGDALEASGRDSVSLKMAGSMALDGSVGKITMDLNSLIPGAGSGKITLLVVDRTMYMDFKALIAAVAKDDDVLPREFRRVKWLTLTVPKNQPGSASPSSYTQYLDYLRGASKDRVTELEPETIDGVATRHFKATIELDAVRKAVDKLKAGSPKSIREGIQEGMKAVASAKAIPVQAWIAKDGTPRRLKMTIEMKTPSVGTMTMDMTMNLSDFGVDIGDIKAPASAESMPFDEFQEFARS